MGRRLALIIGNSCYDDSGLARLPAPDADVLALAEVLRDPSIGGFHEVQPLVNETFFRTRRAIARFFAGRKSDDLLLLYFSGHGVRDAHGILHLAVRDTERDLLGATAIESSFITGCMDRCTSKRLVLVLDCCHSGAFSYGAKAAAGESVGTAAAFEGIGRGRIVLTATDATQYAWEGDTPIGTPQPSVFTRHLTSGLRTGAADRDRDGLVTIDELYDYVHDQVLNETTKQVPGKWVFKQEGKLVIARSPAARRPEPPLPPPQPRPSPVDHPQPWSSAVRSFLLRHPVAISSGIALSLALLIVPAIPWRASPQRAAVEPSADAPEPASEEPPLTSGREPANASTPAGAAGSTAESPPAPRPSASAPASSGRALERTIRSRPAGSAPPAAREPDAVAQPAGQPREEAAERTGGAGGASPSSGNPAPTPAPAPPPANRESTPPTPTPEALIKETLAGYERAAEARDLDLLRTVWPGAPESLRRRYENMTSQSIDLRPCGDPVLEKDRATVVCRERVSVVGAGGISPLPVTNTATFVLRHTPEGWKIDEIKRQGVR
jgi:hypothetical protein